MHFYDILRHQFRILLYSLHILAVLHVTRLYGNMPPFFWRLVIFYFHNTCRMYMMPYLIQQEYPFSILFKTAYNTTGINTPPPPPPPPPPTHPLPKKYFCISSTSNTLLTSSLPGSSNNTYQNYLPPFFVLVTYSF